MPVMTAMGARGLSNLFADLEVDATPDAPLAEHTWFGLGGRADALVRPRTVDALATLVRRAWLQGTPVRVLGSGANLLVADEGVDGIVVKLDAPCFTESLTNAKGEVEAMRVGAGADLAKTLNEATRRGLEGLSHLAGIPSSIGGAIRMNAGGRYGATGDTVHSVGCLSRSGEIRVYPASELRFGYRETNIPDPIVLWAAFRLQQVDPVALRDRVMEIMNYKKSTQPLAENSAGCMFRNPTLPGGERTSAGRLIDEAGLKGTTVGGAAISMRHGNFVTVERGTRTADVLELVRRVQVQVREVHGVELVREVVFWSREGGDGPEGEAR
jgi:UDP-N-acetylmuramate dehydrogenase